MNLKVLWSRLTSLVEEEAKTLIRTSFSNVLSETGDLAAALFDRKGRMLTQSSVGSPGHIDTLPAAITHFLEHFPANKIERGDVLISNNAYEISGHLLDVTIVTPAFKERKIVGYFASTCHMEDMGGLGFSSEGDSIFEEGLQIPYLKYRKAFEFNEDIQAIIAINCRAPDEVLGDLKAQVIANDVVVERLIDLMGEFELEEIDTVGDEIIERSEAAMRKAISQLPNGSYKGEVTSDGFDEPVTLKCRISVEDEELVVDFAGSSPASHKAINVCRNYASAYTTFALKAVLAPDVPNNAGISRPIEIKTPGGSILNAQRPMPVTARHVIGQFAAETVIRALYEALPDRVIAESTTGAWIIQTMGEGANLQPFTYVIFAAGGMGARPDQDGLSATTFPANIRGIPIEIIETGAPLIIHERELRPDSGGPGQFRGGLGQTIRMSARTGRSWRLPALFDRTHFPPRGLAGGLTGSPGRIRLNDKEMLEPKRLHRLGADDTITLELPGGGGYGPPLNRDPELVRQDVMRGYVSAEMAEKVYKVVVVEQGNVWEIDSERTKKLRRLSQDA